MYLYITICTSLSRLWSHFGMTVAYSSLIQQLHCFCKLFSPKFSFAHVQISTNLFPLVFVVVNVEFGSSVHSIFNTLPSLPSVAQLATGKIREIFLDLYKIVNMISRFSVEKTCLFHSDSFDVHQDCTSP